MFLILVGGKFFVLFGGLKLIRLYYRYKRNGIIFFVDWGLIFFYGKGWVDDDKVIFYRDLFLVKICWGYN